jgi:cell division protein FtsI (penicillin-binding protein 3)
MRSLVGIGLFQVACASSSPAPAPPPAKNASSVEVVAREEVQRVVAELHPSASVAVVLAPDGAVAALVGYDGDKNDPRVATERTFVTGSTLKTMTYAAAFEEKTIAPDAKVDCSTRAYPQGELRDASPHGTLTLAEALAVSSNTAAARVFDTLGLDRTVAWLHRFHLDDAPAKLPKIADPGSLDAAMLAAGEVLETTPLQMAAAYGAVLGGGIYVHPTTHEKTRVLREDTVATLLPMLEGVVTNGTGKTAAIAGHRVAGKTGTADHHGKYYGSFIGTVLDAKTRFVILVGFELPKGDGYTGSKVAAPVFARIATRLL